MKLDPATSQIIKWNPAQPVFWVFQKNSNIIWRQSLVHKLYAMCSRWMLLISKMAYLILSYFACHDMPSILIYHFTISNLKNPFSISYCVFCANYHWHILEIFPSSLSIKHTRYITTPNCFGLQLKEKSYEQAGSLIEPRS